jgi:hypothetical protein
VDAFHLLLVETPRYFLPATTYIFKALQGATLIARLH